MPKYNVTYSITVDAEDEAQAYALADDGKGGGAWEATLATPPALKLLMDVLGEDEDDVTYMVQCPHCKTSSTEITEVDKAVRYNVADLEFDGEQFGLAYGTGDTDFEHDYYVCSTCNKPVSLPEDHDDPDESWN